MQLAHIRHVVEQQRRYLSRHLRRWPPLQRWRRITRPAWLGTLRRTTPLSMHWGYDRGTPIDRYYIEHFLEQHSADIRGRVLEIKDSTYTERYGSNVQRSEVLDIDPTNVRTTIIVDLAAADAIKADIFDCFILTQTLQLIDDPRAALAHAYRILRPGGVLLLTVPSVSQIVHGPGLKQDYWRFTTASCTRLCGNVFGDDQIVVQSHGNVLTSIAFLMGMAAEELRPAELGTYDPYFPLIVTVRAVKRIGREVLIA